MARLIIRNIARTPVRAAPQNLLQWFITSALCLLASLISPAAFAQVSATAPVPPQMRLGDAMKPLSYHAELTIVPERDQFDGELTRDIEVMQAQNLFWLNATNLNVKTANLNLNGQTLSATLIKTKQDFIGLQFTQALPLGQGRLTLVYSGELSRKNTHGLFKQKDGANWYVYSQFEDTYARRAFPCLEDYFGRSYPFAKLDSLVIPVTINFGAMENVGLITYKSNLMLAPAGREDTRFQHNYASIAAHEIAHQWFGDLVTMAWWNDLWLNESFATWMAHKTMKTFRQILI